MSNSNISKRLAQVKPGTLFAGCDLALSDNVVVVMDEQARQRDRIHFHHEAASYQRLLERLEKDRLKYGASQVVLAMEPTNYFWKLPAQWLEQHGQVYHLVNALTVNRHREGDQIDRAKDDERDAFVIADLARTGKYTETQLQHGSFAELREYATLYYQLDKNLDRENAYLWGLVGQVFPELRRVFKSLDGVNVVAMLKACPAAHTIRHLSEAEFLQQVRDHFTGKRLYSRKMGQAYRLASTSIGLVDGIPAYQCAIQIHLSHRDQLKQEIIQVIQALQACLQGIAVTPYLLSIKGLNQLSVALFLAEIGDPQRYRHAGQLVKLAGIQPTPNISGRKQRSATPMSHQGRPGLRTLLYTACLRLVQIDPHFQEVYHTLQTRKHNPLTKMQALGVLMNKLLHILWAVMRDQVLYHPYPLSPA